MKTRLSVVLSAILIAISSLFVVNTPAASAEDCPSYDLSKLFFEEYYGATKWDNSSAPRTLTWTTEVSSVEGLPITRKFTEQESTWLQESFDSWDVALDSINFVRQSDTSTALIQVGFVSINDNGFWTIRQRGDFRVSGTIQISSASPFITTRNGFIEAAQSEIGNLLGLGDIAGDVDVDSVMKDPDTSPYGSIPLSDYDIDLIRQFYGESTCHSSWSQALKDDKAKAVLAIAAEKKAAAEALIRAAAEAQAKLDAEVQAAAEAKAALEEKTRIAEEKLYRAEIAALKASLKKKTTITCVKGKLIKKVTAVKPTCPSGYKKK